MKSGVYYLYEYKNNQKSRNVGFLKLFQQSDSFSLQLCARGLSVFQNDVVALSALFFFEEHFSACPVESVTCENHAITCRLEIPTRSLSKPHSLDQLAGFLLELPGGSYVAAAEEACCFSPAHLTTCIPTPEPEPEPKSVPELGPESKPVPEPEPESKPVPEPEPESKPVPEPEPVQTHTKLQKLSRSELSVLPRQYWHLANNSFLLHGYYNYNHLLLIEEDGHFLLGIPGIYDKQEARAAELFGFPSFSQSYADQVQLSEDEAQMPGTFGHWFRKIPKK